MRSLPLAVVDTPADTPPSPAPVEAKQKPSPAKKKPEPVKGKRDNPDYCQANAYVPKSLRRAVDKALLRCRGAGLQQPDRRPCCGSGLNLAAYPNSCVSAYPASRIAVARIQLLTIQLAAYPTTRLAGAIAFSQAGRGSIDSIRLSSKTARGQNGYPLGGSSIMGQDVSGQQPAKPRKRQSGKPADRPSVLKVKSTIHLIG